MICTTKAFVKVNKENKMTLDPSLLHELLVDNFGREEGGILYKTATDENFLKLAGDRAKFGELGELTFHSLLELTHTNVNELKVLAFYNKKIGSGRMDYETAIRRALSFNKLPEIGSKYMAIVTQVDTNEYLLKVVERSSHNEKILEDTLANRGVVDKLKFFIRKMGGNVEYVDRSTVNADGLYDTTEVRKTQDTFINVIKVAKDKKTDSTVLAEETGHFVVGLLGEDHPLIQRLVTLLANNPEFLQQVLGSDIVSNTMGNYREAAGRLIGLYLLLELNKDGLFEGTSNLLDKIDGKLREMCADIDDNEVAKSLLEIRNIALSIAKSVANNTFEGSMENAFRTPEKRHKGDFTMGNLANDVNTTIKALSSEIGDLLPTLGTLIRNLLDLDNAKNLNSGTNFQNGYQPSQEEFDTNMILANVLQALLQAITLMENELITKLQAIDTSSLYYTTEDLLEHAKLLAAAEKAWASYRSLLGYLNSFIKSQGIDVNTPFTIRNTYGESFSFNLKSLQEKFSVLNESLRNEVWDKEKFVAQLYYARILGTDYIRIASHVVWDVGAGIRVLRGIDYNLNPNRSKEETEKQYAGDVYTNDEAFISQRMLFDDRAEGSWVARWCASLSNNPRLSSQLLDKMIKISLLKAHTKSIETTEKLMALEAKALGLGITSFISWYEKYPDNTLTGNIITEYNWGLYERDKQEAEKNWSEEFKATYPQYKKMTSLTRSVLWSNFLSAKEALWKRDHIMRDSNGKPIPYKNDGHGGNVYDNTAEFNRVIGKDPRVLEVYNEYMELKRSLDAQLRPGTTFENRLPQHRSDVTHRIRMWWADNRGFKRTMKSIWKAVSERFAVNSDEDMYGGDLELRPWEKDLLGNDTIDRRDLLNRVPVFGIHKLKDADSLSTDLIGTTVAYAAMCYLNACLREVSGMCLITRKLALPETDNMALDRSSDSIAAVDKYLERLLYNGGIYKSYGQAKGILKGVSTSIKGLGTKIYLYGNVAGGIVNQLTGIFNGFQEAMVGERFTVGDYVAAIGELLKEGFPLLFSHGYVNPTTKLGLMCRKFNMLNDNKMLFQTYNTYGSRAQFFTRFILGSMMFPYHSGEYFMQTATYIAMMKRKKCWVRLPNGVLKESNIWDAYKVGHLTDAQGNTPHRIQDWMQDNIKNLETGGLIFLTKSAEEMDRNISDAIQELRSWGNNSTYGGLSSDVHSALSLAGVSASTNLNLRVVRQKIIKRLQDELKNGHYCFSDNPVMQSAFMDSCRETNDRLHGIYNEVDKIRLQSSVLGSMWASFKGYAFGYFEDTFRESHYNTGLGLSVEGKEIILAKMTRMVLSKKFWEAAADYDRRKGLSKTQHFFKNVGRVLMPCFNGAHLSFLTTQCGFSKSQYYALKRALMNLTFYILKFALDKFLEMMMGGDDEDYNVGWGIAYYFMHRLLREHEGWSMVYPLGTLREGNSLGQLMPPGVQAAWEIIMMGFELYATTLVDVEEDANYLKLRLLEGKDAPFLSEDWRWAFWYEHAYYTKSKKNYVIAKGDEKWKHRVKRFIPYYKSAMVFLDPKTAAANYDLANSFKL